MGAPQNAPPQAGSGAPSQGYQGPPAGWSPQHPMMAAPRPMNWDMLSFLARFVGLILIFVAALIVVATGNPGGSLFGTSAPSASDLANFAQGKANGLLAGRIVLTIGLFILGLGAGIKLHWVLRMPTSGRSEEVAWTMLERLFNYAVLAGTLVALVWLVVGNVITLVPP